MNRNLPHAERLIRTALSVSTSNQARAVAHALDMARLLVDPERTFGFVLHRTPSGGWARVPGRPTELEQQAFDWDHACERARLLAATIEQHIGRHPDVLGIRADGDRVRIELHVTDQEQWRRWRAHFGIRRDAEKPLPHGAIGESNHSGVRVSVLAHQRRQMPWPAPAPSTPAPAPAPAPAATPADAPAASPHALPMTASRHTASVAEAQHTVAGVAPDVDPPMYEFEGITYNLALPQQDVQGDVWYFHGRRTPDGMPLLSLDGRSERCTLANVTYLLGPLVALEPRPRSAPADEAPAPRPATRTAPPAQPDLTPAASATPAVVAASSGGAPLPVVRRSRVVRLSAARLAVVAPRATVDAAPAPATPSAATALTVVRSAPDEPTEPTESTDATTPAAPSSPARPTRPPTEASAPGKPAPRALRPPPALPSTASLASLPSGPYVPGIRHVGLVRTGPATWEAAERTATRSKK